MARVITQEDIRLTSLRRTDALVMQRWLSEFLLAHNSAWSSVSGLGWSSSEVEVQIMATGLVEEHWASVKRAAANPSRHVVLVARAGDRPLGIVWASERRHPYLKVPVGSLDWVYVEPGARGRGIAGRMVEDAKRWMRVRGLKVCQVNVLADNEPARRLYARAGLAPADMRMMGSLDPIEPA